MNSFRRKILPLLSLAIFVLANPAVGAPAPDNTLYGRIVVVMMTEDTTSEFHYVHFFDKERALVRVIEIWNGGCCQTPFAYDFKVNGKKSTYQGSYEPFSKRNIVEQILCDHPPQHIEEDSPKMDPIDWELLREEGVAFSGCD